MNTHLSAAEIEALGACARQLRATAHGGKEAVYAEWARFMSRSVGWVKRGVSAVTVRAPRKRRSDVGQRTLALAEAEQLSAYLVKHQRGNGKASITLGKAVQDLRGSGVISAARLDAQTGELLPLSTSAIAAALRAYGMHPEQLRRLAPAQQQRSLHPNHVWQMDASVCTLFYLDDAGSHEMPEQLFYKNKPENFERIASRRVTRFVITDHTSGSVKVRYFHGSESVANYAEFFLWAIGKTGRTAMHGVPLALMVDPGSGMAGAFKNLVRRLRIELIVNAPGNPRAKGQVENAQNLVEMGFESQFRARRPASLAELNDRAQVWMDHFNATAIHSRHGSTRDLKWQEITAAQLRVPQDAEVLRQLLTADHKLCKVNAFMQVQFGGGKRYWDVRHVAGAAPGEKLAITYNAYNDREVFAVFIGQDGSEQLEPCPLVERDANGFTATAPVIGEGYVALPDTAIDRARKRAEQIAADAPTQDEAQRRLRRTDVQVMGGRVRFDYLQRELDAQPTLLPRRGTELQTTAITTSTSTPVHAAPLLNHFVTAAWLTANGVPPSPERHASVRAWYPEGVPDDEGVKQALKARLLAKSALRVVGGNQS